MSIKSEAIRTIRGGQRFLSDLPFPRLLETRVLTAEIFKGTFEPSVPPPPAEGRWVFFAADIPGLNTMTRGRSDLPLLAPGVVRYKEEPLAVAAAENDEALDELCDSIRIDYHEEVPHLTLETGSRRAVGESVLHKEGRDDRIAGPLAAAAEDPSAANERAGSAQHVVTGEYAVRFQEFQLPEPQGAVALWEKQLLTVYCPTRNPFHVRENVSLVLGLPVDRICLVVPDAVEDPGDKETLPAVTASLAALIAFRTGRAARVTLANTIKQYPALVRLASRLTPSGLIAGTTARLYMDTGCCSLHSPDLFHRAVYALPGAYRHHGLELEARTIVTDQPPYTRLLSGGAAEAFFAIESHVTRLARVAGLDPITFRLANVHRPAGGERAPGAAERVLDEVAKLSDFKRKYAAFEALRPAGGAAADLKTQARGMGAALAFYGFDFIEEAETRERHAVTLTLEKDGTLRILTSALETGQALRRLFTAIAARSLDIDPEDVSIESTDTSLVPDSGPMYETHALTSIGKLIELGCLSLRAKKGKTKKAITVTKTEAAPAARRTRGRPVYRPSDEPLLSWCAVAVEIELDPAAFLVGVKGIWAAIECGTVLNRGIAAAQAEREIRRAWDAVEETPYLHRHKLRHSAEVPVVHIAFVEIPSAHGPLGAKGLGELPGLALAPAYAAAVSQALGRDVDFYPLAPPLLAELMEGG